MGSNPPDVTVAAGPSLTLTDGGGQIWDIQGNGNINNGSSDAYDGMFYLSVGGFSFPYLGSAVTQDGRELVLGPSVLSGLNVTRKIHVDNVAASLSYTRFLETLSNPTASPITVTVQISGNLGSDEGSDLVTNSSSGDTTASGADFWVTNHQQSWDPALGFLFPGATSVTKTADNLTYQFQNVVVPAGATVTILHWAFQNTGAQPAAVQEIEAFLGTLTSAADIPSDYLRGLSQAEVLLSLVPIAGDGVVGGAGSVAPFATVTVTNTATAEVVVRSADSDGSFRAIFGPAGASTGDVITVTATDGTNATLTFP